MYGEGIKDILNGAVGRERIPLSEAHTFAMTNYIEYDKKMRELLKNNENALSLYEKLTKSMIDAQNTLAEDYFVAGFRLGAKIGEDLYDRKILF